MTLYYVKQDNMGWCCEADSGPYYEDHEESFVDCECELLDNTMTAEHLQDCNGGGPVIEWRAAKMKELSAHSSGRYDGYNDGFSFGREREREVVIATLNERIKDLESCTKDDGCQLRADGIRLAISDIEFKGEN